jgi:DNA-binding HxlR family transcriptional regulator
LRVPLEGISLRTKKKASQTRYPDGPQTLRHMERGGLLTRTVHPVVPPKVEYKLTQLGLSLGAAFCGVWIWATDNLDQVEKARVEFDEKAARSAV